MLYIVLRILLMFALPIATAVIWKISTQSRWSSLFFAFGAFAINSLMINFVFTPLLSPADSSFSPAWFLTSLLFGLTREGIRWLVIFYLAKKIRSWEEGVMFGIGYNIASILYLKGDLAYFAVLESDIFPNAFITAFMHLYYLSVWPFMTMWVWSWGVDLLIFNVGTSLVVLFSVMHRDLRLLLIPITLYLLRAVLEALSHSYLETLTQLSNPSSQFIQEIFVTDLMTFFVAIPCLWLIFRLREPMDIITRKERLW